MPHTEKHDIETISCGKTFLIVVKPISSRLSPSLAQYLRLALNVSPSNMLSNLFWFGAPVLNGMKCCASNMTLSQLTPNPGKYRYSTKLSLENVSVDVSKFWVSISSMFVALFHLVKTNLVLLKLASLMLASPFSPKPAGVFGGVTRAGGEAARLNTSSTTEGVSDDIFHPTIKILVLVQLIWCWSTLAKSPTVMIVPDFV